MLIKSFQFIFERVKKPARLVRNSALSMFYSGRGRWCPVCEKYSRKFCAYGIVPREDALCMRCGALERYRLVWIYFKRETNLFNRQPLKMLHVAPEEIFEKPLKHQLGNGYLTADLYNPRAMVKMDITDIQYPDESFDVIYCSHVLEHVVDDRKAIREFVRVLKPSGWAILLVPITTDRTFEDFSIVDSVERSKLFGQKDHVRNYGPDYIERLRKAGFDVKEIHPADFLTKEEITCMGITSEAGEIFYCTKKRV